MMKKTMARFCISIIAITCVAFSGSVAYTAPLKELNVSFVKAPFNLPSIVSKKLGMIEEEFKADGIKVNFHEITSGSKQSQAMAAGSLDVANVINTTSVLIANSAGNRIKIVGGYSRATGLFAIVAKDPAIKTVKDLKGKKIAGPKGTVLHQMLLVALNKEGMSAKDVEFVFMNIPDALTALLAGSVDGALLAASQMVKAEKAGGRVIATAQGLVVPLLTIAVPEDFLKKYPDIVKRYLKVHEKALKYIQEHTEEALKIGAEEDGIPIEEARRLYQGTTFITRLTKTDLDGIEQDQAFLIENKMMKEKVDISALIDPMAME